MTISPEARAALERLVASADDLVRALAETGDDPLHQAKLRGIATMVGSYIETIRLGLVRNDARTALAGANRLTTVNKAVANVEDGGDQPSVGDKAFLVLQDGIEAAKLLRKEVGLL